MMIEPSCFVDEVEVVLAGEVELDALLVLNWVIDGTGGLVEVTPGGDLIATSTSDLADSEPSVDLR